MKPITHYFPELVIIRRYINKSEYFSEEKHISGKDRVMQHCSVSSSNWLDIWWNQQVGKIATSWGVSKLGELLFFFPDEYWGYQTGLGAAYDSKSVGIELINKALVKYINGQYYWIAGSTLQRYTDKPFILEKPILGSQFWDPYPDAQVDSYAKLVAYLCVKYNIPANMVTKVEYDYRYCNLSTKGIINHSNVSTQRSDPGPAFPYQKAQALVTKYVEHIKNMDSVK